MAIAIPSPAQSKSFLSSMGNLWENTSPASIPMVSVMSYQYPPLPLVNIKMGMPPQGFMPSSTVPFQQLSSLSIFNHSQHQPVILYILRKQMSNHNKWEEKEKQARLSSHFSGLCPSTKNPTSIAVPTTIEVTRTEGFPPEMRVSYASPTNQNPFGMRNQDLSNWMLADADQSPTSNTGELNPTWQTYPSESPMSMQFSPFASVPPLSVGWTSGSSKPTSHGDVDLAWGPYAHPLRSMLYGGEPLASHRPSQYPLMASSRQFERRPSALSDVYITSMSGVVPGFEAGTSSNMNPAVPLSAGLVTSANHTAWDQSQPRPGYTFIKNQDAYAGGWPSGRNGRGHPLQVAGPSQAQPAIQ
ncbi:hypothetical protein FOFC_08839 [Fusarium oxysporum]|nr:hypothetical protein FOFC_08839 [Fusarium oxysporum]